MTDIYKSRDKSFFEEIEEEKLSPLALKSSRARRRHHVRDEGRHFNYRTEFQRDRDRILHSRAFRRLNHKTQVYIYQENDHFRTRMAHTMEVGQLSRVIARSLNLNEDLTEAISLGHDLGQTPFGISGRKVFGELIKGKYDISGVEKSLFESIDSYNSSVQSLRVVDLLEKRYEHRGLNLTNYVREGIAKSDGETHPDLPDELRPGKPLFPEGQIVAHADGIARKAHNLEDGMRAGEINLSQVEELSIGKEIIKNLGEDYTRIRDEFLKGNRMIRGIIHLLVTSTILTSGENMDTWSEENDVNTSEDYMGKMSALPGDLIDFSKNARDMYRELDEFLDKIKENSPIINRYNLKVKKVILRLFKTYYQNPLQLENYFLIRFKDENNLNYLRDIPSGDIEKEVERNYKNSSEFIRALIDHMLGMTDIYALKEYNNLINFNYQGF